MIINIEQLQSYTANPSKEVQEEEIRVLDGLNEYLRTTGDERFRAAVLLARAAIKDTIEVNLTPSLGDVFIDIQSVNKVYYVWDGESWVQS